MNILATSLPFYYNNTPILNGICITQATHSEIITQATNFLHQDEKLYFDDLTNPTAQQSYLLGKYCAKRAIKKLTNTDNLKDILIQPGVWGQPIVTVPHMPNISISLSHSHLHAAALSFHESFPMGIDIETLNPNNMDAMKEISSLQEREQLKRLMISAEEIVAAASIWTLKEGLSKALKCGLTVPFSMLEAYNFKKHYSFITCEFAYFPQYFGVSWRKENIVIGIAYPKQMLLDFEYMEKAITYPSKMYL